MKLPGCLSTLNEEQHSVLVSMLAMGKYDSEIADAIIENGWCAGVKPGTILRNVNRWRKGKGQEAVLKQITDKMVTPAGKMKRQIDVLEELTQLVLKQKKRIEKISGTEDKNPVLLLGQVSDEMKALVQMLEKLAKLQLDTGILRKVRTGEVEGDYAEVTDVDAEEPEEIWTEEDRRLLEVVRSEFFPQLEAPK